MARPVAEVRLDLDIAGGARITIRSYSIQRPAGFFTRPVSNSLNCRLESVYYQPNHWYAICPKLIQSHGFAAAGSLDLQPLYDALKQMGYSGVVLLIHAPDLNFTSDLSPPWSEYR